MTNELNGFLELAALPAVYAVCALGGLLLITTILTPPEARRLGWVGDLITFVVGGGVLAAVVLAVVFGVGLGLGVSWAEIAAG